jgi:CBS domain-containing protein
MRVREIMTGEPVCCTADTPLHEVAELMLSGDCGEIPVLDDRDARHPVGVVTDRDIVCRSLARGGDPLRMTAGDVMTSPAVTVMPEMRIQDCCRLLEQYQVRRAPVVDARGRCCGMISLADIALHSHAAVTAEVVRSVSQRSVGPLRRAFARA